MATRAVARLDPLGDSPALVRALANLSGHQLVTGHYDECIVTARRAVAMAEPFDLEYELVYALNSLGAALGSKGQEDEGVVGRVRRPIHLRLDLVVDRPVGARR